MLRQKNKRRNKRNKERGVSSDQRVHVKQDSGSRYEARKEGAMTGEGYVQEGESKREKRKGPKKRASQADAPGKGQGERQLLSHPRVEKRLGLNTERGRENRASCNSHH